MCVDPATGEVSDDKGQFAPEGQSGPEVDENGNGMVCYSAAAGVIVDDEVSRDPNDPDGPFVSSCPPGYVHMPVLLFP